ncbi:MAG TPA: hypothetical protein PKD18_03865 [Saprospiraceae bacterium]|nr:hypothetical protein [Saprospiraceae bacterium]
MAKNNSTPMVLSSNNWMFIALAFLLLQSACKQIDKESNTSFSFIEENGESTALNPTHHLEFAAKANRFEVKQPYQAHKPISIELKKLKVDGKPLEIASSPKFDIKDNSLYQVAEDYTIEYVNDDKGLRQNFIINGEGSDEDISFELELGVISELEMSKINDFGVEFVDDRGNSMLTYKDLITFDDNNKILDSRMSFEKLGDDQYQVLIKGSGRGVSYPITIDPLMTSYSSYESTMAGNETGTSVEGKCDVDGDGFCWITWFY